MTKPGIVHLIDQQTWLEPIADTLQRWTEQAYAASGPTGRQIKNILSGTWFGHPLHPALTDLPIGAWTAAALFDLMEASGSGRAYATAADTAVAGGVVSALVTAVTGLSDWHYTVDEQRRVGLAHGLLNLTATTLYGASLVARLRGARGWGRSLGYLGWSISALAAYLGGELVYHERIGVDHAPEEAPGEFVAVLPEGELREGEPRRVEAAGIPIMLVRQSGGIYALAEHCAHLGGPLSEGRLERGSITCPWHASRFALLDGQVLEGPATFNQPCYQTRVRDGSIEVGPPCEQMAAEAPELGSELAVRQASG